MDVVAPLAYGILVPWAGIKPAYPASQSGFLSTDTPGRSYCYFWRMLFVVCFIQGFMGFSPSIIFFQAQMKRLQSLFLLLYKQRSFEGSCCYKFLFLAVCSRLTVTCLTGGCVCVRNFVVLLVSVFCFVYFFLFIYLAVLGFTWLPWWLRR